MMWYALVFGYMVLCVAVFVLAMKEWGMLDRKKKGDD